MRQGDFYLIFLLLSSARCDILPNELAVWWSSEYVSSCLLSSDIFLIVLQCLKLSAVAAQVLNEERLLNIHKLEFHRECNFQ
jgi:sterol 3beta-glucosyltransferase